MKKLRGFYAVLLVAFSLFGYTAQIKAQEEAGYVYDSLHVEVEINDQREYKVTEIMVIDFEEPMHGILRSIPLSSEVESYNIKDVNVSGMPFTVESNQDSYEVRIGDEDTMVSGEQTITLTYTLEHYQDYDNANDYVYMNLLGDDYDTQVKNFSAQITFPSPEKMLTYQLTSGMSSSTSNFYVKAEHIGNRINVASKKPIPALHGVTLKMKFEEGVFANAPEYQFPYIIHDNQMKVEVDESQDIHVEQNITIEVASKYQQIYLPMIQEEWEKGTYKLKDVKISDSDLKYQEGAITFYAQKEESKNVTISYTVHPYQLIENQIQFSLFKNAEDTKMENFSLALTMPYLPNPMVDLRRDQDENQEDQFQISKGEHTWNLQAKNVQAGEHFMVRVPVESRYFQRDHADLLKVGFVICCGFLVVMILLRFVVFKKKELIVPVNFYPPKGINPAEAGYLIDAMLTDKDIISLIFYWADKGYLKIANIDSEFTFEKIKDMENSLPFYECQLFSSMFSYGTKEKVTKNDLKYVFYQDIRKAKQGIYQIYKGEKELRSSFVESIRVCCIIASVFPILVMNTLQQYVMYESIYEAVMTNLLFVPVFFLVFLIIKSIQKYRRESVALPTKIMGIVTMVIFTLVICFFSFGFLCDDSIYVFIGFLITILSLILAFGIHKDSRYREEMLSSLLGFKEFMKTAEKDELEMLLEEDPEYYYHVLPYAQVLHVSDIWENKFKGITIPAPSWYDSNEIFYYAAFHNMIDDLNSDMISASVAPSASGSGDDSSGGGFSGGGSSFSGGGSVGGGSGGGGSHGW